MIFITHHDPVLDLGGTRNGPRKTPFMRALIGHLKCSVTGHDPYATGYANAHKYSWLDWRIGNFRQCRCCGMRMFELETQEQFDEVMETERLRWEEFYAQPENTEAQPA